MLKGVIMGACEASKGLLFFGVETDVVIMGFEGLIYLLDEGICLHLPTQIKKRDRYINNKNYCPNARILQI